MEVIHWDAKTQKLLFPRKRQPSSSKRKKSSPWAKIAKNLNLEKWERGLGLNTPTLRRSLKDTILKVRTNKPLEADPGILLCCLEGNKEVLDWYFAQGKAELALQAAFDAVELHEGVCEASYLHRVSSEPIFDSEFVNLKLWKHLRILLHDCSDEVYKSAHKWAERRRATLDTCKACVLCFLFPEEEEWSREAVAELLKNPPSNRWGTWVPEASWLVLHSLADLDLLKRVLDQFEHLPTWAPWPIVEVAGKEAATLLKPRVQNFNALTVEFMKPLLQALSLIESPEVATLFCELKEKKLSKSLKSILNDYFPRYPRLALQTLPSKDSSLLEAIVRSNREVAVGCLAELSDSAQKIVKKLLEPGENSSAEAKPNQIPSLLANPPWRCRKKSKKTKVVEGVVSLSEESRVDWRGRAEPRKYFYDRPPTRASQKDIEAGLKRLQKELPQLNIFEIDRVPDESALRFFAEQPSKVWAIYQDSLLPLTARFGVKAVIPLEKLLKPRGDLASAALLPIVAPSVAPVMAEGLEKKRSFTNARDWFERYPEVAVHGLIPVAVGPTGKARDSAEKALRLLEPSLVSKIAQQYEPKVKECVQEILDSDPLLLFPKKLPKLPDFACPDQLPQLLTKDGLALPKAAVEEFLVMLAFAELSNPYAGVDVLKEELDKESTVKFCWELFQAWLRAGAKAKEQWAFLSLAHFGDDDTARDLTPLIRQWPGESGHQRAVSGLDVLCHIGTDVALLNLHGIAQKLPYKGLQKKAQEKILQIAEKRGLTADELADRLVPDLGLDSSGRLFLDFGPRQFEVRLDAQLKASLYSEGKSIKSLPKPTKSDGAELAAASKKLMSGLKKDLKLVANSQVFRLERAMTFQRRWESEIFRRFLVEPPLLFTLAKRLVWGSYEKQNLTTTFRLAEDRSLADLDDEPLSLPRDREIGIVHPIELSHRERSQWLEVFTDYELLQPFAQLQRPIHQDSSPRSETVEKYLGQTRPFSRLLSLEDRGWKRGEVYDSGVVVHLEKSLPGFYLELQFEPGLYLGNLRESGDQTVERLVLKKAPDTAVKLPLEDLPPIAWSELIIDLESLL